MPACPIYSITTEVFFESVLTFVPNHDRLTKISYPTEDVGVEADVVFRDVEMALDQDFPLEGAAVVYGEVRQGIE